MVIEPATSLATLCSWFFLSGLFIFSLGSFYIHTITRQPKRHDNTDDNQESANQ